MLSNDEIIERLMLRTEKVNEHWLFTGDCNDAGYGITTIDGLKYRVHRLSAYVYLNLTNLDDGNQQVNHKCEFKNCWNPEHIYVGTNKENGVDYKNSRLVCKNGHPLSIYGRMRKRYSWERIPTRLKCMECDRIIRRKSANRNKIT